MSFLFRLNINIDDVSSMEMWEKEALFKTLLLDVNMEFKLADLAVSLYTNSRIYEGKVPEDILEKVLKKIQ